MLYIQREKERNEERKKRERGERKREVLGKGPVCDFLQF